MWSYFTSSTRSGRSGVNPRSLPALQRLWVPGTRSGLAVRNSFHLPHGWSSIGQTSGCSSSISSARRAAVKLALTPMCCSSPSAYRPEQQAAEQRLLRGRRLVLAVARDDDVGGALVLDLQHGAAVRDVRRVERLGDHAVEPGALELLEPLLGLGRVGGGAGQEARAAVEVGERLLQGGAALGERPVDVRRVAQREQVEGDEAGGGLLREHVDAATWRGWMRSWRTSNSSRSPTADEQLAVEHDPLRELLLDGGDELGEVAGERLGVAAGRARPRRRRGRRCSGSRPTWARSSGPPCLAGSGIPLTALASIGWTGGITGRSTPPTLVLAASARTTAAGRRRTTRRRP